MNSDITFDTLAFSLGNVRVFSGDSDPSGDNYNEESNPDGTEGNGELDEGELFIDFGIDNCPDSLETGLDSEPCDILVTLYNPQGTEGNNQLDWDDDGNPYKVRYSDSTREAQRLKAENDKLKP